MDMQKPIWKCRKPVALVDEARPKKFIKGSYSSLPTSPRLTGSSKSIVHFIARTVQLSSLNYHLRTSENKTWRNGQNQRAGIGTIFPNPVPIIERGLSPQNIPTKVHSMEFSLNEQIVSRLQNLKSSQNGSSTSAVLFPPECSDIRYALQVIPSAPVRRNRVR